MVVIFILSEKQISVSCILYQQSILYQQFCYCINNISCVFCSKQNFSYGLKTKEKLLLQSYSLQLDKKRKSLSQCAQQRINITTIYYGTIYMHGYITNIHYIHSYLFMPITSCINNAYSFYANIDYE